MKDIESRLRKLETGVEDQSSEANVQIMKQKFHPVMQDIERWLIALENRPVETAISNVSCRGKSLNDDYADTKNSSFGIEGE